MVWLLKLPNNHSPGMIIFIVYRRRVVNNFIMLYLYFNVYFFLILSLFKSRFNVYMGSGWTSGLKSLGLYKKCLYNAFKHILKHIHCRWDASVKGMPVRRPKYQFFIVHRVSPQVDLCVLRCTFYSLLLIFWSVVSSWITFKL